MKIVRFLGGLGNQMFQYAFYKALQKRFPDVKADLHGFNDYPLHNGFELDSIFEIKINKVSLFVSNLYYIHNRKWIYKRLRRVLNLKKCYQEEAVYFKFDPSLLTNPESRYYWGYWQNFNYFKDISDELQSDFHFKNPLDKKNQAVLNQIGKTNSIAIHIRRGDYLKDPLLGGVCDLEYYLNAIKHIQSKLTSTKFFIFSDDIPWCMDNLNLHDSEFISWNKGPSSYIDLQLMSACKHQIIANSSFSWWAAWLNKNPEKIIICPKYWVSQNNQEMNMQMPEDWIRL